MFELFNNDLTFYCRVKILFNLFALKWKLIVINKLSNQDISNKSKINLLNSFILKTKLKEELVKKICLIYDKKIQRT